MTTYTDVPFFGYSIGEMEAMGAAVEARRQAALAAPDPLEMIWRAGRAGIFATVKQRARYFQRHPEYLDAIPGIAAWSSPAAIIAACEIQQREPLPRNIGFGGYVRPANIAGAKLYARWLRRVYRAAERLSEDAV